MEEDPRLKPWGTWRQRQLQLQGQQQTLWFGERMRVEMVDGAIPAGEIVAAMKAGADGAVCVFDGIVRDNSRGRRTLHLDYEAYREMALEKMGALAAEAVARFGVRDVAVVHRLGRLVVGETSVLVVVASAHRGAAFDACRWLIDTLKKTVPIWKKEQFVDGAVWADGEPFPDSIGLQETSEDNGLRLRANAHLSAIKPREDGAPAPAPAPAPVPAHVPKAGHGAPAPAPAHVPKAGHGAPGGEESV